MFGPLKKLPRLLQWDGRTRSSRQEEPLLRQLANRNILLRLAVVWLTELGLAAADANSVSSGRAEAFVPTVKAAINTSVLSGIRQRLFIAVVSA